MTISSSARFLYLSRNTKHYMNRVYLYQDGLARLEKRRRWEPKDRQQTLDELEKFQTEAREKRLGMWEYGDIASDDEDTGPPARKTAAGKRWKLEFLQPVPILSSVELSQCTRRGGLKRSTGSWCFLTEEPYGSERHGLSFRFLLVTYQTPPQDSFLLVEWTILFSLLFFKLQTLNKAGWDFSLNFFVTYLETLFLTGLFVKMRVFYRSRLILGC